MGSEFAHPAQQVLQAHEDDVGMGFVLLKTMAALAKSLMLPYVGVMEHFIPKLDVLPAAQRKVWAELSGIPPEFTLYGGTAVALHLGHRQSIDFDFFGNKSVAPIELAGSLPLLEGGIVLQSEPNTLTMLIDRGGPVKLSFFGVPRLKKIRPPLVASDNGLQIASLLDLAGTKATVVQQRAEAKDYIDIDAILYDGQIDLPKSLAAAQYIYGSVFSPQNALKALTYFDEPQLQLLSHVLKLRLVKAVRAVDLNCLPKLEELEHL
jgi:Nucleotidyl transferase AbiEii toxin, Type IV TA system